jgi:hypothetical protein
MTPVGDFLKQRGCRPVVIASHPRSGTHLLIDSLRLNFTECRTWKWWGERMDRLYLNLASLNSATNPLSERKAIRILRRSKMPLVKTHARVDFRCDVVDGPLLDASVSALSAWLRQNAVLLYTYRDGRNALCSFFEMERRLRTAKDISFSEFIRQRPHDVNRVLEWADHVRGWMQRADVFCISMEELLAHPAVCLEGVAEKLGLPFDRSTCKLPRRTPTVTLGRLHRLLLLHPQSTAIIHSGNGRIDWRRYFTPADRRFFADESGDLLIKLGYEEDAAWVDPANDDKPRSYTGFFASGKDQKKVAGPVASPPTAAAAVNS